MSLDPDSLRCFELAATTLNFREAASRVHLSPAAFSDRVRRMEEELGVRLFERTTRSVRLSSAGARLLPHARQALEAAEAMRRAAARERDTWSLTLGTRAELGLSWLTPALDRLDANDPDRTVHLWVGDGPALVEAVRLGRIDAMVSSFRMDTTDLVSEPLHEEAYRFVGSPALLDREPFRGPESAPRHVLLDTQPALPLFRYLLDRVGGPTWPFASRRYLGGIGSVRALVRAGKGVAVLPAYFVSDDIRRGELVELMPATRPASDEFRLTWRSGHPRGAQLAALADELRAFPLQ